MVAICNIFDYIEALKLGIDLDSLDLIQISLFFVLDGGVGDCVMVAICNFYYYIKALKLGIDLDSLDLIESA